MVINQILDESRDYYLDYQGRLVGELLISPVGSIKRKKGWGGWFLYLHKRKGRKFEDVYLGGENDPVVQKIAEKIKNRQRLLRELRSAKNALRLLKAGKMGRAPTRKKKKEKDLRQVCAVAKRIITEENLREEVRRLLKNMPQSWQNKINTSALCISDYVADCKIDFSAILSHPKQMKP